MPALGTKFHLPRPRQSLVRRDRLASPFNVAALPRLVLIAASAGFGKTTLLTQWLTESMPGEQLGTTPFRAAWVSLDEGDADVQQFLDALVGSVQHSDADAGAEARSILENDGATPSEDVLAALINDLDQLAGRTVLALDDYHRADARAVHDALTFLLDNLPPQVCVAITTRTDPPLPIARLRTRGELVEVRAADLRFTRAESADFMHRVMDLPLAEAHIEALEERTEGWVAGLQLAALSARSRTRAGRPEDLEQFIRDFSGSHRFVLDYLVEEVLEGQTDDRRQFLLRTSVLEQLTGSLCDAMTGRTDGQLTLEQLERGNVFIVPLDEQREWYRYHRLFADALQARLMAEQSHLVRALHHSASRWYAERGRLEDAVRHASLAQEVDWLAELVELALPDLRRHRRTSTIVEWLDAIPEQELRQRPVLATARAWSRLNQGDLVGAEEWLDIADRPPAQLSTTEAFIPAPLGRARDDERRTAPATTAIYRAALAQAHGDAEATFIQARRAQDLSTEADHVVQGAAAGFLGLAAWAEGDLTAAVETFTKAVEHLGAAGNLADQLGATVVLADMALASGGPLEARRLYEVAFEAAEAHPSAGHRIIADLHVGLADVLIELDDLASATEHLNTARELGEHSSLPENWFRLHAATARLLAASGRYEDAIEAFGTVQAQYLPGFFPDLQPLHAIRARLWVRSGQLTEARAWAAEHTAELLDRPVYRNEYVQLTLARVTIAEHRAGLSAQADLDFITGVLDQIVEMASDVGRFGSIVEARLVRALNHAARGNDADAHLDLGVALTAGVPAGYRRLFLDEGRPAETLLRRFLAAAPAAPSASFAKQVLGRTGRTSAAAPTLLLGGESLSEREIEVTRLLATDLTGPEIAAHLYISINTLRTHSKHIFTKLDVKTRRAAVTRAIALGLL